MSDSFCKPYNNPRTGNRTYGGAARNGRLKTLGGVDEIVKRTTERAIDAFLTDADSNDESNSK
ncbi:hypothetical protein QQA20_25215 [Vibrio parahaemolyticus]|uniref:hypothetical protein n=1 Tax=Vibrio parahaemolyticus TaxID=670 RepID=UPI0004DF28BB|nr:hypothetical protein [Vibrio parahaemolyticus]MBY4654328.1 hypothetical protein [Vibrio parahaemolyticus]MCR9855839.1 hypothetical protein [Vibrio parahaemolyticus]MDK9506353.1 hypothetical protein [Vibrio parahaemolyticus]MRE11696.1 hypothetical protein [Vibrio parahaemolyticus]NKJ89601.1 hypothetical protein [Vibrio parahaemolyticus]